MIDRMTDPHGVRERFSKTYAEWMREFLCVPIRLHRFGGRRTLRAAFARSFPHLWWDTYGAAVWRATFHSLVGNVRSGHHKNAKVAVRPARRDVQSASRSDCIEEALHNQSVSCPTRARPADAQQASASSMLRANVALNSSAKLFP